VKHMQDNMGACHGRLPEPADRERMVRFLAQV
jgi:hypothetical protein